MPAIVWGAVRRERILGVEDENCLEDSGTLLPLSLNEFEAH